MLEEEVFHNAKEKVEKVLVLVFADLFVLVPVCTGCLKKTEFYQIEHLEILLPVGKKYL